MIRRWSEFRQRVRRRYYDGPAVFAFPGRRMRGYRSPTILGLTWLLAGFQLFLTPGGFLLFFAAGPISLAGMLSPLMPAYYLTFALFWLFLTDILIGWLTRPKATITRRLPTAVAVNQPFTVEYEIRNTSHVPLNHLGIDRIPFPSRLQPLSPPLFTGRLEPNAVFHGQRQFIAKRRGIYFLPLPLVDSAFPFGLCRWGCLGEKTRALRVYPAYTSLESGWLPPNLPGKQQGTAPMAHHPGESLHFLSCREYRYGDSPRRIHAPSWARLNLPVVKEFSQENRRRVTVILDPGLSAPRWWRRLISRRLPQWPHSSFEARLSLTAAISEFLLNEGCEIDLFIPGMQAKPTDEAGKGTACLDAILERLAGLEPLNNETLPPIDRVMERRVAETGAVFVLGNWDASRREWVRQLPESTLHLVLVSPGVPADTASFPGLHVSPDAIRQNQVRRLA